MGSHGTGIPHVRRMGLEDVHSPWTYISQINRIPNQQTIKLPFGRSCITFSKRQTCKSKGIWLHEWLLNFTGKLVGKCRPVSFFGNQRTWGWSCLFWLFCPNIFLSFVKLVAKGAKLVFVYLNTWQPATLFSHSGELFQQLIWSQHLDLFNRIPLRRNKMKVYLPTHEQLIFCGKCRYAIDPNGSVMGIELDTHRTQPWKSPKLVIWVWILKLTPWKR